MVVNIIVKIEISNNCILTAMLPEAADLIEMASDSFSLRILTVLLAGLKNE